MNGGFQEGAVWEADKTLAEVISGMAAAVRDILGDRFLSMYLYGSVTLDDFRPGWSDIDVLILTRSSVNRQEAQKLLQLRQKLAKERQESLYRAFEGVILPLAALEEGQTGKVVYWGTSGERIRESFMMDVFSGYELLHRGRLVFGDSIQWKMPLPRYEDLVEGVKSHYHTIRQYAKETGDNLYACGWLLDIARCLYTLRCRDVIGKMQAGEWALQNGLCPAKETLSKTLEIRRSPLVYRDDPAVKAWLKTLGPDVQAFADVLEEELLKCRI